MRMLSIENISKEFGMKEGRVMALACVSLEVGAGEFVAVMGGSGSGKTTLLLAAGGLQVPTSGRVMIDGTDVYSLGREDRASFRAQSVGFVFQQFHLVPYLTVFENVLLPDLALDGGPDPAPARRRAFEMIEKFNLAHRVSHRPSELSAGEQQRTAMARAFLNGPKVVFADEPTGNLDESNAEIIIEYLADFAASGGAVFMATHSRAAAAGAHRRLDIDNGRIATGE